jgi:hypothetical protein
MRFNAISFKIRVKLLLGRRTLRRSAFPHDFHPGRGIKTHDIAGFEDFLKKSPDSRAIFKMSGDNKW